MRTLDEIIDDLELLRVTTQSESEYELVISVLHFLKELRYILDNLVWVKPEEKGHWEIRSLLPEDDERTEK